MRNKVVELELRYWSWWSYKELENDSNVADLKDLTDQCRYTPNTEHPTSLDVGAIVLVVIVVVFLSSKEVGPNI
jgi:hypothetical protein